MREKLRSLRSLALRIVWLPPGELPGKRLIGTRWINLARRTTRLWLATLLPGRWQPRDPGALLKNSLSTLPARFAPMGSPARIA